MVTKYDIGDTVEIIPHPHEFQANVKINPWVIDGIEIGRDGVTTYRMTSVKDPRTSTSRYTDERIRKPPMTDKDIRRIAYEQLKKEFEGV